MASSLSAASWLLAGTTVNLMMAQIVLLDDLLHISVLSLKKHVVTKLGPEQLPSVLDTVHCTLYSIQPSTKLGRQSNKHVCRGGHKEIFIW